MWNPPILSSQQIFTESLLRTRQLPGTGNSDTERQTDPLPPGKHDLVTVPSALRDWDNSLSKESTEQNFMCWEVFQRDLSALT